MAAPPRPSMVNASRTGAGMTIQRVPSAKSSITILAASSVSSAALKSRGGRGVSGGGASRH